MDGLGMILAAVTVIGAVVFVLLLILDGDADDDDESTWFLGHQV